MASTGNGNSEKGAHVKEQSLLFNPFEAYEKGESSHKSDFFLSENIFFPDVCATCSELPSNISTMR